MESETTDWNNKNVLPILGRFQLGERFLLLGQLLLGQRKLSQFGI